jgi:hypothetical protein
MNKKSVINPLIKYCLVVFILVNFYGCAGKYLLSKDELDNVTKQLEVVQITLENIHSDITQVKNKQDNLSLTFNLILEETASYFNTFNEQVYHFYSQIEDRFITLQKDVINLHNKIRNEDNETLNLTSTVKTTDKIVVGEMEKIKITPPGLVFVARIDSGAASSSIDARNVQTFERDKKEWVRFQIPDPNDEELLHTVERPVVRWTKITQSSTVEQERRAVVEFQFEIGPIKRVEEFNLTDRSHMSFAVLVGRNILRDLMVVDVSKKFATALSSDNSSPDNNSLGAK